MMIGGRDQLVRLVFDLFPGVRVNGDGDLKRGAIRRFHVILADGDERVHLRRRDRLPFCDRFGEGIETFAGEEGEVKGHATGVGVECLQATQSQQ